MVDVHSHIVFEVDDGAKTITQTIQMCQEAEKAGFDKIIATPHYMDHSYEIKKDEIKEKISKINEELYSAGCKIKVYQGNEIYFTRHINEFIEKEYASTLNGSRYVLFELPLNGEVLNLSQVVYQLLEKGMIPVLAHPERYAFIQKDITKLIPLIESGILVQCNYGSILGRYGSKAKKTFIKMLKHNMVHFLGSDAHRPESTYNVISEANKMIKNIIGEENLRELVEINPQKVLDNENIEILDIIPIKEGFIDKIKNKLKN